MKKWILWMSALVVLFATALHGQNITGTWQGALKGGPVGPPELRIVVKISLDNDKPKAVFYSITQQSPPIPVATTSFDGSALKMTITAISGTYEGKLSGDGNSITGNWTQGGSPLQPLNFVRATPETAWVIPDPPPPPKLMVADAKPTFEVATIKPSKPEERFSLLVNRSGMLNTTSTSVSDLLKFAYDLHPRQITGGPAWVESEKFTISAKPDTEGMPSIAQLKMMVQKLLADRFELKFHRDKKELSVYAITETKTGHKLTKSENNPTGLPLFAGGGPRGMTVRNSTMAEFGNVMQANALDRPVVDQSGLGSARWDFTLKWTPDGAQVTLATGQSGAAPADADAPPDIFAAFQQQLGLKLESTKAPVDVVVIDRVEKPSAN